MAEKILMKGNEAIGEAAIVAGCRHYFGYPITPQTELTEYMARRMPQVQGVFLQAESEVAAINMVYGAAGTGVRVMTSSSSPGISLKQEGISYIAGAELPCVIVNIMRGGPGLGGIQPGQADYFQAVKGGGHGDYHTIVLAPNSVQELVDMTVQAFDLAEQYRNPVMLLGDGALGQMMEPVAFTATTVSCADKPWAAKGMRGRSEPNIINSLYLQAEKLEEHNIHLQNKYALIQSREAQWEQLYTEDADLVLVAYGITSRIVRTAMEKARTQGHKVGLFRPKTLWPFPSEELEKLAKHVKGFLVAELSAGQMLEDVKLAVNGQKPVSFYGRTGGMMPSPKVIHEQLLKTLHEQGGK